MTSAATGIVIGCGLAGLTVALSLLDRGGTVVIVEKEHKLGGNSIKASSGINAFTPENSRHDSIDSFRQDTLQSAGKAARSDLIETLVTNSANALQWLKERISVDLTGEIAQLGGHSNPRTHRPSDLPVGAEIMIKLQKAVKSFEESGHLKILVDSRVTKILSDNVGRGTCGGSRVWKQRNKSDA